MIGQLKKNVAMILAKMLFSCPMSSLGYSIKSGLQNSRQKFVYFVKSLNIHFDYKTLWEEFYGIKLCIFTIGFLLTKLLKLHPRLIFDGISCLFK